MKEPLKNYFTPYSPALTETLQTLIAPGRRARISPFVESAQFQMLFNRPPDPAKRYEDARKMLREHPQVVENAARAWKDFYEKGGHFRPRVYLEGFLQAYLAYYLTTNVCKLQLVLFELVRQERLAGDLILEDIGVGTGTTALAVLDFLIAWADVCDLYGAAFPITSLQLVGSDASADCLGFARKTVEAYADALAERLAYTKKGRVSGVLEKAERWARQARWDGCDLNRHPLNVSTDIPTILVASNVLNEFGPEGKENLANTIRQLPQESIAIIIEPGGKDQTFELNRWRKELICQDKDLIAAAPCGGEYDIRPLPCETCWNARRESLHRPMLYDHFCKVAFSLPNPRKFNEFENYLLSWSYICLLRSHAEEVSYPLAQKEYKNSERIRRHIGSFSHKRPGPDYLDNPEESGQWTEIVKLCPGHPDVRELLIKRKSEFQFPFLIHGERIRIENVTAQWRSRAERVGEYVQNKETRITPIRQPIRIPETFLPAYSEPVRQAVDEIAYRIFGFPAMLPFQHRVLESALCGKNILGIAATGIGKSECFILPAMVLPGITIVVSPLNSLMQDQYDQRLSRRYGLDHVSTFVNGNLSFGEKQARLRRLELGWYKLAYFTPEQLEQAHVLDSLRRANETIGIRYLTLDEAHCISQWGHDFRPSYLNLVRRFRRWGIRPTRIALTATASPEVRQDLCEELDLDASPLEQGGEVYVYASNRPELNLIVRVMADSIEKSDAILDDLRALLERNEAEGSMDGAIIFMPHTGGDPDHLHGYFPLIQTQKNALRGRVDPGVTRFASYLEQRLGKHVAIYHGRMNYDDKASDTEQSRKGEPLPLGDLRGRRRKTEQDAFIRGEREIMVATKGFGMGIDKSDIRLIIHRTSPPNLEAYVQEAGRAGRDGRMADIILYHSPDTPGKVDRPGIIPSDYTIQKRFIKNRHIRHLDGIIMRDFLRTIRGRRTVGPYLYFTNDEAMDFFNRFPEDYTSYQWPDFSLRQKGPKEFGEHEAVLDLGHIYEQKTRHIGRILSVLCRIRPKLPGQKKRAAFLEKVQETGIRLVRPEVRNAKAILNSNYYFGRLLREKGLSPAQFEAWVQECEQNDMLEFGEFLGLSPGETASMFQDIRSAGRDLMDFRLIVAPRYGPATGKDSLEAWRAHAGARTRANKKAADERRKQRGSTDRTLDDWFGWPELVRSKGWEVLPGPAFERDEEFDDYLEAVMKLHDQRRQNDWDAYHRLLTDYVGVNEKGEPDPEGSCLRSVMLGYLETYEVITGDNCLSCSRCVPDYRFEEDMERRRSLVASLGGFVKEALDNLKNRYVEALPPPEVVAEFWKVAEREQRAGRSMFSYLEGWTGRLLADIPGHRASLWLRITGMAHGFIPLRPSEFVSNLRWIIRSEDVSQAELRQIWTLLETVHELLPEHIEIPIIQGSVCQRLLLRTAEKKAWARLFAHPGERNDLIRRIHRGLREDREMLRYATDEFMRHPDFKRAAHQAWLSRCAGWKDEIVPHLKRCLALNPPEIGMAEASLELLLREENDAELRRLSLGDVSGHSSRIDRVVELSERLDRLTEESDMAQASKLKPAHFSALFSRFAPEEDVERADMAVAVIAHLRHHLRPKSWHTAYHARALHHARRFEEMNQILSKHPELTREQGFLAEQFSRLREKIMPDSPEMKLAALLKENPHPKAPRPAPINESDYQRVIRNRMGGWTAWTRRSGHRWQAG